MIYDNEPFPPEDGMAERLGSLVEKSNIDAWIEQFKKSSVGQYLNNHPFIALTILIYTIMTIVPIGLFLGFGLVTFAITTMSLLFIEIFLLAAGGATLLCTLGCLAIAAVSWSFLLSAFYIIFSHIYKLHDGKRPLTEKKRRVVRLKKD